MTEHDAVWAQTTDGGLLQQLFGHYPSVHEARIREVRLRRQDSQMSLVADYVDQGDRDRFAARVQLEWHRVSFIDLPLDLEHLVSLQFGREGTTIVTTLETWPGVFGQVRSEGFEAILSQMQPGDGDEIPRLQVDWQ